MNSSDELADHPLTSSAPIVGGHREKYTTISPRF
jgi:hypothetical protein